MSRKESKIADLHTNKGTWKLVLRITTMWAAKKTNGKDAIEMVFMDTEGSKIQGTLSQDMFPDFKDLLKEGSAYLIQNIKVIDNFSEYKVSAIPFSLLFVKSTHIKEFDCPEIPANLHTLTPFSDIISGSATTDVLVDIVGVVSDVLERYTLRPTFRVTVKLRDNSGAEIIMTVWEDYACKLGVAIDKSCVDKKPIVVMLTLGKIKAATEKYPLSVQNIKAGSKLFINDDVPDIRAFSERLDLSQPIFIGVPSGEGGLSQSQYSQYSQGSAFNIFLQNARMVSFDELQRLNEDYYCLTVGTVDEIVIDLPWSYDSCPHCTTTFDPKNFGSNCRTCHNLVTEILPRYKLVMKLQYNGKRASFNFWDAICIKIFGKTADECRKELIKDGEDVKVFPGCVDDLIGKTWAVRFRYRVQMRQASVTDVSEDVETIKTIEANIYNNEDDASTPVVNVAIGDSPSQEVYPTPSLSQSADYDPSMPGMKTPAKRMPIDLASDSLGTQESTPFKLSANKHIKSE